MRYVTYIAVEGLCNRLRTHFVAHAYALHTKRQFFVDWSVVKAFGVRYSDLFELNSFPEFNRYSLNSTLINFYRKFSMQRYNGKLLNESQTIKSLPDSPAKLVVFGEAFYPWAYENNGAVLDEYLDVVIDSVKPRAEILKKINDIRGRFSSKTVGIHIRRGDFHISFPDKIIPIENYVEVARHIVKSYPDVKFFLATDDFDEAKPLMDEFDCIYQEKAKRTSRSDPYKIFHYNNKCNRDTKQGALEAVADMYLLSATNLIIGSEVSSFSKMASFIGKTRLVIPNKQFFDNFSLHKNPFLSKNNGTKNMFG